MNPEITMSELLEQRRFPIAALALVAEIDYVTAFRIVKGITRPRGTTAARMAEGLGIGYGRMGRILAATREAAQAAESAATDTGQGSAESPAVMVPPGVAPSPITTTGSPVRAAGRAPTPGGA